MAIGIGEGRFPILSPEQANPALTGYNRTLQTALNRTNLKKQQALLPFAAPQAAANLQSTQLANQGAAAVLPYKGPQAAEQLESTQLKNALQQIINQFAPENQKAGIDQKEAMAHFYNSGGPGRGVFQQLQQNAQGLISLMNPQLKNDPKRLLDAQNAYETGQTQLADGTKLAPMNPTLSQALGALVLHSTTAPLATQLTRGNQAENELSKISKMSDEDLKPYGNTYGGVSLQAVRDSMKIDDGSKSYEESQKRLGNFMAGNAIQFEKALIRTAMAGGPAGIKAVNQLVHESQQYIQQKYPHVSEKSRYYANQRLNQYFDEINRARNQVGTSLLNLPIANAKANAGGDKSSEDISLNTSDPLGIR